MERVQPARGGHHAVPQVSNSSDSNGSTVRRLVHHVVDGLRGFLVAAVGEVGRTRISKQREHRRYLFHNEGDTSDAEEDGNTNTAMDAAARDSEAAQITQARDELLSMLPERPRAIAKELIEETLACALCLESIRRKSRTWSCPSCHQILHLRCMRDLAALAPERTHAQCPCCRAAYSVATLAVYRCFCGEMTCPPYHENAKVALTIPHACPSRCCGRIVGGGNGDSSVESVLRGSRSGSSNDAAASRRERASAARKERCEHRCTLPCHPGPCEKCLRGHCWCGAHTYALNCWEVGEWVDGGSGCRCGSTCDLCCRCITRILAVVWMFGSRWALLCTQENARCVAVDGRTASRGAQQEGVCRRRLSAYCRHVCGQPAGHAGSCPPCCRTTCPCGDKVFPFYCWEATPHGFCQKAKGGCFTTSLRCMPPARVGMVLVFSLLWCIGNLLERQTGQVRH